MKPLLIIATGVALTATPAWAELLMECKLHKTTFSQCSVDQKKCVTVSANEAVQSQLQQIFFMKTPSVTFIDEDRKTKQTSTKDSGYFDFASNQLVVLEKQNGRLVERVYNLQTLNEVSYQGSHGGQP